MSNGYQPPPPPVPKKSGMPVWGWFAIGCGCLTVLVAAILIFGVGWGIKKAANFAEEFESNPGSAIETLIALNPELDVVDNVPNDQKITIRNNKTGEVSTFDYSDIREGKFRFESDEGEFSIDADGNEEGGGITFTGPEGETRIGASADASDLPPWLPLYPTALELTPGMTITNNDRAQGVVTANTTDSVDKVREHYEEWFNSEGFEPNVTTINAGGHQQVMINAKKGNEYQIGVTIGLNQDAGNTQIALTYDGPAQ